MLGFPNSALSGASRDLAPHPQPAFPKSSTISLSLYSTLSPLPEPPITSHFTEERAAKKLRTCSSFPHLASLVRRRFLLPKVSMPPCVVVRSIHRSPSSVPLSQLYPLPWVSGYNLIPSLFSAHTCLLPFPTCFSLLCCRALLLLSCEHSSHPPPPPPTPLVSPGAIASPKVLHSWIFYSVAMPSAAASAHPHC